MNLEMGVYASRWEMQQWNLLRNHGSRNESQDGCVCSSRNDSLRNEHRDESVCFIMWVISKKTKKKKGFSLTSLIINWFLHEMAKALDPTSGFKARW